MAGAWSGLIGELRCANPNARVQQAFSAYSPPKRLLIRTSPERMAAYDDWVRERKRARAAQRQERELQKLRDKTSSADTTPAAASPVDPAELREVIGRYINLAETDVERETLELLATAYVRGDEGAHRSLLKFVKPLLARR